MGEGDAVHAGLILRAEKQRDDPGRIGLQGQRTMSNHCRLRATSCCAQIVRGRGNRLGLGVLLHFSSCCSRCCAPLLEER